MQSDEETKCFKRFKKSIEEKCHTRDPGAIEEEVKLIYEVKDICDELHLIGRVLGNQYDVLTKFSNLFWPGTHEVAEKRRGQFIHDCGIEPLVNRAQSLKENAQRTLEAVSPKRKVQYQRRNVRKFERLMLS